MWAVWRQSAGLWTLGRDELFALWVDPLQPLPVWLWQPNASGAWLGSAARCSPCGPAQGRGGWECPCCKAAEGLCLAGLGLFS